MARNFGLPLLTKSTPRGPAIPAGGPRIRPVSGGGIVTRTHKNKKGYTGTRAGVGHRGRARLPTTASNSPHGPASHPFSSTQLPARKRFGGPVAVPKSPGRLSSLFRRIRGK